MDSGFSFNFKYMNTHLKTLCTLPPSGLKNFGFSFYILLLKQWVRNDIITSESFISWSEFFRFIWLLSCFWFSLFLAVTNPYPDLYVKLIYFHITSFSLISLCVLTHTHTHKKSSERASVVIFSHYESILLTK